MLTGQNRKRRKLSAGFLAPCIAILLFFVVMFLPMLAFRYFSGIPLESKDAPEWEIWLIILGGGLGAGMARLTHNLILWRLGGFNQEEIDQRWYGKKKKMMFGRKKRTSKLSYKR